MTFWTRLSDLLASLPLAVPVGQAIDRLVDGVRTMFAPSPERQQLAFTISMIALSAKMAKADGVVTADEVAIVRRLLVVPDSERAHVARLFNLARQDTAGFEAYAAKIQRLHEEAPEALEDVLDGLFTIAGADGVIHERELVFLETVAGIFEMDEVAFGRVEARHVRRGEGDPFRILGIVRGTAPDEVRAAYLRLVRENHPDRLIARGLPADSVKLANDRLAAINRAYEDISRQWAT